MPDNKDIFSAPPSQAELDAIFSAPPSKEELAAIQSTPVQEDKGISLPFVSPETGKAIVDTSKQTAEDVVAGLPAAGAGALKGVSFGASDKLRAAGGAVADLASQAGQGQVPNVLGLPQKYAELLKARQASTAATQAEFPKAFFGGEVAGNIASMAVAPEILGGGELLGAASKVGPETAAFLAGSSPEALAIGNALKLGKLTPQAAEAMLSTAPKAGILKQVAGKATSDALLNAPGGAAFGAGESEHGLSEPVELGKDIMTGAATAGLGAAAVGGGTKIASSLAESAGKRAMQSPYVAKLVEGYKMGQSHIDPYTSEGIALQMTAANKNIPVEVANNIMDMDKYLGNNIGKVLDEHSRLVISGEAQPLNISDNIQRSMNSLQQKFEQEPLLLNLMDKKSQDAINTFATKGVEDLTPNEAQALKQSYYDAANKLENSGGDGLVIAQARQLGKALDSELKTQVPGYEDAASRFNRARTLIAETFQQPGVPISQRTESLGDIEGLKNKYQELTGSVRNVLGGATMPGTSSSDMSKVGMFEVKKRLNYLAKSDPEAFSILSKGQTAQQYYADLASKSAKMGSVYQGQGVDPHEGLMKSLTGSVVGSGQGLSYNIASRLGSVQSTVSQTAPVKLAAAAFNAPDSILSGIANKMKSSSITASMGQKLEDAIKIGGKDPQAKTAILYQMMQNPYYRKLLTTEAGVVEPEGSTP